MLPGYPLPKDLLNKKPEAEKQAEEKRPEPTTAQGNKELASEHLAKGRVHQAITRYKKAAHIDNSSENRTDLGDAYAFAELPVKAVQQYRKALKKNSKNPETHFSLAELYIRYGKWQAAAAQYEIAVKLQPDNHYYRFKLAQAYTQMTCPQEAICQMEEAVALKPKDEFYRFELANLYADAGRNEDAIIEMEYVINLCPEDDYYLMRLGTLYARVGRNERALTMYNKAIGINPNKLAYRQLLADIYYIMGYEAEAEREACESENMDYYDADFVHRARRFMLGGNW